MLTDALALVPTEAGRKQMVGEWLFPMLSGMKQVANPAKVTGMLLELDIGQLLDCLESPQLLQAAVTAALEALGVATAVPPPDPPPAAVPARHAPPHHKPPAEAKPRQPNPAKAQAAKTKLCKYFIQMGYCKNGDACDFAHGVDDMPQQAWLGLGLGSGSVRVRVRIRVRVRVRNRLNYP